MQHLFSRFIVYVVTVPGPGTLLDRAIDCLWTSHQLSELLILNIFPKLGCQTMIATRFCKYYFAIFNHDPVSNDLLYQLCMYSFPHGRNCHSTETSVVSFIGFHPL